MKANEILKKIDEALYNVYSPSEEAEEGLTPESRQKYDGDDIRNIAFSYFIGENGDSEFVNSFLAELPQEYQEVVLRARRITIDAIFDRFADTITLGTEILNARDLGTNYVERLKLTILNKLPDEAIADYLRRQGDTQVERVD